ncbi:MAG: tyrosine-type recombinase/integrase [Myxococcaceae bacterium]
MARTKSKRPGIREMSPGQFLVQIQVGGNRKTARVTGTMADAITRHAELVQEANGQGSAPQTSTTAKLGSGGLSNAPSLREWLRGRFAERSQVVQAATTRKVVESQIRYLVFYLGDRRIDEIGPAELNWYVEKRKADGPLSFTLTKEKKPRHPHCTEISNAGINKSLSILRAALYLALHEGVVDKPPRVELLPEDDASPVVPPTDAVLEEILAEAEKVRAGAPLLPEAIELSVETGLREGELFNLTWGSVDYSLGPKREGGIRVEEQGRGRIVGGKRWTPKNRRSRIVPLSPRAREILDQLRGDTIPRADALVIPNKDGCPYLRLQTAEKGSGTSTWRVMKEAMGHDVRWHDLRHVFAVRCLQANIDLGTVSRWLGHSDINLTVKRYGRFAADSHEQWAKIARVSRAGDSGPACEAR